MSWASSEWKDGLPSRALQKIEETEQQLEKLKRERQQKQCQIDTLEQSLEKQKRKNEEDRLTLAQMTKENKILSDTCEELERKRQKIEHDLQTREAYVACLEGQLSHSKQCFDAEVAKVTQLKQEIGLLQSTNQALTSRAEKLTIDYTRMQEMSSHQRKQIDDQRDQIASLQTGFKHGGLSTPIRRFVAAGIETGSSVDTTDTAKFTQRIAELECQLARLTDEKNQAFDELRRLQEVTKKDVNEIHTALPATTPHLILDSRPAATAAPGNLVMIEQQPVDSRLCEVSKVTADNEGLKRTVDTLKQQIQDYELKLIAAEEKAKKMQLEAECHRHNAESIKMSFDQKVKEKEKEHRLDMGHLQESLKDAENRYVQLNTTSTKESNRLTAENESLRGQLDKATQKVAEVEKQLSAQQDRIKSVDSLISEHKKEMTARQSTIDHLTAEKAQVSALVDARDNEVARLNMEITSLKEKLTQASQVNDEIRGRMLDYQLEAESLQAKIESLVDDHQKSVTNLQSDLIDVRQTNEKLSEELSMCILARDELGNQLVENRTELERQRQIKLETDKQCRQLVEQVDKLTQCIAQNELSYKKLEEKLAECSTSLKARELHVEQLSSQLSDCSFELERTRTELSSMSEKHQLAEQKLLEAEEVLSALRVSEKQYSEKLMNMENDVSDLTEEVELMKSINNLSDQTNRKLQKRLEEYQCQIATFEEQMKQLQGTEQQHCAEIESLQGCLRQSSDDISVARNENERLLKYLDVERSQCEELRQLLSAAECQCSNLTERCLQLEKSLETSIQMHRDVVDELEQKCAASTELITSKDKELASVTGRLASCLLDYDSVKSNLIMTERRCGQAELTIQQRDETIEMIQKSHCEEKQALEKLLTETQTEFTQSTEQIQDLQEQLGNLQNELDKMSQQLTDSATEATALQQSVDQLSAELLTTRDRNRELMAKLDDLCESHVREKAELVESCKQLQSARQSLEVKLIQMTDIVDTMTTEKNELASALKEETSQRMQLHDSLSSQSCLVTSLRQELDDLQAQLEFLRCEFDAQKQLLDQATVSIENFKINEDSAAKHLVKVEEENKSLHTEVAVLQSNLAELESTLKEDFKAERDAMQQIIDDLKQQSTIAHDLNQVQVSEMSTKLLCLQSEFASLKAIRDELASQCSMKDELIGTAEANIVNLKQVLQQNLDELGGNKEELCSKNQEIADLLQETQRYANDLSSAKEQTEMLSNELASAADQLALKKLKCSELAIQVEEIQKALEDKESSLKRCEVENQALLAEMEGLKLNFDCFTEQHNQQLTASADEISSLQNLLDLSRADFMNLRETLSDREQYVVLMDTKLNSLSADLEVRNAEIAGLLLEVSVKTSAIEMKQSECEKLKDQLSCISTQAVEYQSQVDYKNGEIDKLKTTVDQLQSELIEKDKKLALVENQLKLLETEMLGRSDVMSVKDASLAESKAVILSLQNEIESLKLRLEVADTLVSDTSLQVASLTQKLDEERFNFGSVTARLDEKNCIISQLEFRITSLTEALEEKTGHVCKLSDELTSRTAEVQQSHEETAILRGRISQLEVQNEDCCQKRDAAFKTVEELKGKIDELQVNLSTTADSLEQARAIHNQQLQQLEEANEKLSCEIQNLVEEKNALTQHLSDRTEELIGEKEILEEWLEKLKSDLASVNSSSALKFEQVDDLNAKNAILEEQLSKLQADLLSSVETLNVEIEDHSKLKDLYRQLNVDMTSLAAEHGELLETIASQTDQVRNLESCMDHMKSEHQLLSNQLDDCKAELFSARNDMRELAADSKSQLESAVVERDSISNELEEAKSRLQAALSEQSVVAAQLADCLIKLESMAANGEEKEKFSAELMECRAELETAVRQRDNLSAELREARERVEEVDSTRVALSAEFDACRARIQSLLDENEALVSKSFEQEAEIEAVTGRCKSVSDELADCRMELETAQCDREICLIESAKCKAELEDALRSSETISVELLECKTKLEAENCRCLALSAELAECKVKLDVASNECCALSAELAESKVKLTEASSLIASNEKLVGELEDMKLKYASVCEENSQLLLKLDIAETERDAAKQSAIDSSESERALLERNCELEKLYQSKQNDLEDVHKRVWEFRESVSALEKALELSEKERIARDLQLVELKKDYQELRQCCDVHEKDLVEQSEQRRLEGENYRALRASHDTMTLQCEALQREIHQLTEDSTRTEEALIEKESMEKRLMEEIVGKGKVIDELEKTIAEMKSKLDEEANVIGRNETTEKQLIQEIEAKIALVTELNQENTRLKGELEKELQAAKTTEKEMRDRIGELEQKIVELNSKLEKEIETNRTKLLLEKKLTEECDASKKAIGDLEQKVVELDSRLAKEVEINKTKELLEKQLREECDLYKVMTCDLKQNIVELNSRLEKETALLGLERKRCSDMEMELDSLRHKKPKLPDIEIEFNGKSKELYKHAVEFEQTEQLLLNLKVGNQEKSKARDQLSQRAGADCSNEKKYFDLSAESRVGSVTKAERETSNEPLAAANAESHKSTRDTAENRESDGLVEISYVVPKIVDERGHASTERSGKLVGVVGEEARSDALAGDMSVGKSAAAGEGQQRVRGRFVRNKLPTTTRGTSVVLSSSAHVGITSGPTVPSSCQDSSAAAERQLQSQCVEGSAATLVQPGAVVSTLSNVDSVDAGTTSSAIADDIVDCSVVEVGPCRNLRSKKRLSTEVSAFTELAKKRRSISAPCADSPVDSSSANSRMPVPPATAVTKQSSDADVGRQVKAISHQLSHATLTDTSLATITNSPRKIPDVGRPPRRALRNTKLAVTDITSTADIGLVPTEHETVAAADGHVTTLTRSHRLRSNVPLAASQSTTTSTATNMPKRPEDCHVQ